MTPGAITLHIEHLVLHGFEALDRQELRSAVVAELTRLLAQEGLPGSLAQGSHLASLDSGAFALAQDPGAKQVGTQIARTVIKGLTR